MIEDLTVTSDAAGFPVVSWIETRRSLAAGSGGRERLSCRIMKDGETGVLLFVASGAKRRGEYLEARPWESLKGFSLRPAAGRYVSPEAQVVIDGLGRRKPQQGLVLADTGQVVVAEFMINTDIEINCAEASRVELDRLHAKLVQVFLAQRHGRVAQLCETMYLWPVTDDRVVTFAEDRPALNELDPPSRLTAWIKFGLLLVLVIFVILVLRDAGHL